MTITFSAADFDSSENYPVPALARLRRADLLAALASPQTLRALGVAATVAVIGLAAHSLATSLAGVESGAVWSAIAATSTWTVLAALVFTAASYLALTGYDGFAVRHLGLVIPYKRIALASFISYSLSNSMGFALLTGGSVRYRLYGRDLPGGAGSKAGRIAIVTAICGLTFGLSGAGLVGMAFLLAPSLIAPSLGMPVMGVQLAGMLLLTALGQYLRTVGRGGKTLTLGHIRVPLPSATATLAQIAVGIADILFAGTALYMLLPMAPAVGYLGFIGLFAAAMTLSYYSHVPGGVGVFESIMLIALPDVPAGPLFASLLLFRVIYYLLPLIAGLTIFGTFEARRAIKAYKRRPVILMPVPRTFSR